MDDFIHMQGLPFLAHVLARLRNYLMRGYDEWMPEAGFKAPPKTHSTLQAIRLHGPIGVTDIAVLTRQSHPLVIRWVNQLKTRGLVEGRIDESDARRTVLTLTRAGRAEAEVQDSARIIIARVLDRLMEENDAQVYDALWRIEAACRREPIIDRLRRETAIAKAEFAAPKGS